LKFESMAEMLDTPGAMPPVHVSPPKEICTWLKPNCPNDMGFLARQGTSLRTVPVRRACQPPKVTT
jgi:hypothetical protein